MFTSKCYNLLMPKTTESMDVQEWFQQHPGYNEVHRKIIRQIEEDEKNGKPFKPFADQYRHDPQTSNCRK